MRIASRWQPLIFAALASLALAGFAAYDLYRERDIEISGAKADTANLARLLEAHTAQTLRRVEARLGFAAGRIGEEPAPPAAPPAALQADLRALLPADGLVQALVWLSADGRVLASSLTQPVQAGARALLQDWLARQRAQPEARMIFGRLQQVADGVWQLPIGRALPAAAGAQASALVALVDTASLQPVLDAVDTGRNGFVTLFLTDGWMLATSPHKPALFAKS